MAKKGQEKDIKFKSSLHKKIYLESSEYVFELGKEEIALLKAISGIVTINKFKFQLVEKSEELFLLFKLVRGSLENSYEFKEDDFILRGTSWKILKLSLEDLDTEDKTLTLEENEKVLEKHEKFLKEEESKLPQEILDPTPREEIKVQGSFKQPDFKMESLDEISQRLQEELKGDDQSSKSTSSGLFNYIDSSSNNLRDPLFVKDQVLSHPVNLEEQGSFWFISTANFKNITDQFWRDLRDYYRKNGAAKAEVALNEDGPTPVFSKKYASLDIPKLHDAFVKKISSRIADLEEEKIRLKRDLKALEASLVNKGIVPDEDVSYIELQRTQKDISECLEKARSILDKYSRDLYLVEEAAKGVAEKFFLDVRGQPQVLSRYYEQVISKLLDLNKEVNYVHTKHLELERLLIKRLKDIEDARNSSAKVRKLEQEEILEAFKEENYEIFALHETRKRKDVLKQIGELNASTAEIQRHIEEEKKKIRYYMDNLRVLEKYDQYEVSLFQHKKRKQQLRKQAKEFNVHISKLRALVFAREKKFDDFFSEAKENAYSFKKEVVDAYTENDNLAKAYLDQWWKRWNSEAQPEIDLLLTRSSQLINVFASIPPLQIIKVYEFKKKLRSEAIARQKEWERIYGEIQNEFRSLGYELEKLLPSELENKYLEDLDESKLRLSGATQKILYLPKEWFSLKEQRDTSIGLEPRTLDDDQFAVIDQVWSTLSPEQEARLEKEMQEAKEAKKLKDAEENMKILQRDQLENLKKTFLTKISSFERYTRLFTAAEKAERMRSVEGSQLQDWKDKQYLFSTACGAFKDTIYNLSKKLFVTKSVRMVNSDIKFMDDGYIEDDDVEIMTMKDYFMKLPAQNMFDDSEPITDLSEDPKLLAEPDEETLEDISDPKFLGRVKKIVDPAEKPRKPTIEELVQIGISKYKEHTKSQELDLLKEKLLLLNDEITLIKEYHDKQSKHLELVLSDKSEIFEDMQKDLRDMQEFLKSKEKELESIIEGIEKKLDVSLEEIDESLFSEPEAIEPKKGSVSWFSKLLYGEDYDKEEIK